MSENLANCIGKLLLDPKTIESESQIAESPFHLGEPPIGNA